MAPHLGRPFRMVGGVYTKCSQQKTDCIFKSSLHFQKWYIALCFFPYFQGIKNIIDSESYAEEC